jgi:hypothetical protein
MPSYTETFPCPVCCGTTTTTTTVGPSTTTPPGVCPPGYEPCEGENLWNWFVPPNIGEGLDTTIPPECYWEELIPCSEGCESYPPDFIPLCEAGQEIAAPGLCCKPIIGTTTSTTQSPITTTENPCPQGGSLGWLDAYNADLVCNYCQEFACITDDFNPHRTLQACIDVLMTSYQETGIPMCDVVATTPIP